MLSLTFQLTVKNLSDRHSAYIIIIVFISRISMFDLPCNELRRSTLANGGTIRMVSVSSSSASSLPHKLRWALGRRIGSHVQVVGSIPTPVDSAIGKVPSFLRKDSLFF